MPRPHSTADLPGRLLAILVFCLGIGLLCFTFAQALHLFQSPVPGLGLPIRPGAPPPPAVNIGAALTVFLRQILLLALMILVGSLTAGKGVQLYFSAARASDLVGAGGSHVRTAEAVQAVPPAAEPALPEKKGS